MLRKVFATLCFLAVALGWSSAQAKGGGCNKPFPAMPLRTLHGYVVDQCDRRFSLYAINWYGASDSHEVVGGLDKQSLDDIVKLIKGMGYKAVRLPFSNRMLRATSPVPDAVVSANPKLKGQTPFAIFKATVDALTKGEIAVILNNHTTTSVWCCDYDAQNGLWTNLTQSTEQWMEDWKTVATAFKGNPWVIAADLRNEVRPLKSQDSDLPRMKPVWLTKGVKPVPKFGEQDWRQAASKAGQAVLAINKDLLIIVEGINMTFDIFSKEGLLMRPYLTPMKGAGNELHVDLGASQDRVIYEVHNYPFTGPNRTGGTGVFLDKGPAYKDLPQGELESRLWDEWGFMVYQKQPYPVWVGEFGADGNSPDAPTQQWMKNFVRYVIENDIDVAYWPLNNGPKPGSGTETYGRVTSDWKEAVSDWRDEYFLQLAQHAASKHGQAVTGPRAVAYVAQAYGRGDSANRGRSDDWAAGFYKADCKQGQRVVGVSAYFTILCSDDHANDAIDPASTSTLVTTEGSLLRTTHDWASKHVKLECPINSFVAGVARRPSTTGSFYGILCVANNRAVEAAGKNTYQVHSLVFGSSRANGGGGDWAPQEYKGQCAHDESVVGVAYSYGGEGYQRPQYVLCARPLPKGS